MALGTEAQNSLMKILEIDLTDEESDAIRNVNNSVRVLLDLHIRDIDKPGSARRSKERERDTIERVDKICKINHEAILQMTKIIGINNMIAVYRNKRMSNKTKLNILQLYELHYIIQDNLKNSDIANEIIFSSILEKIQTLLSWKTIGEVDKMYSEIEYTLYRKIITNQITSATVSQ